MTTAMQIVCDVAALRAQVRRWRAAGETIGFVPTMGNLHDGHLALVAQSRQRTRPLYRLDLR